MSKSPNRHNKIFMKVEPLDEKIAEMIRNGTLNEYKDKKEVAKILKDAGWDGDEAKRVMRFDIRGNVMVDGTKRSEEHTPELQSHVNLVCRLLLEKKKKKKREK